MMELTRETLAFALIGAVVLAGVPWLLLTLRQRQRRRLRQRGIKRYGH